VIIERNAGVLTAGYRRSFYTSKPCFFYHFDKIRALSPEKFVAKLKEDFPHLERIVVGYDFHFGKNKAGNAELLERLCDKEVLVIDEVCLGDIPVHSRTIRRFLFEGNIAQANALLGRTYSIEGKVIKGQGLGAKSLVATLNIDVKYQQLPLFGVYATRSYVQHRWEDSITFLGHRQSTDGAFAVESHILDKSLAKIEGKIQIQFIAFLRTNHKFESLEKLKIQIAKDIKKAKEALAQNS
jgi:riboflavin kinase/FMN adenylyltransferase